MQLLSIVSADLGISFTNNQVEVNSMDKSGLGLTCNQVNNEEYKVFFESPIAAFDKCSVTVNKDGAQDVNLIGLLSDRAEGSVTEQLKVKICAKSGTPMNTTAPLLNVVRNFVQPQKSCISQGDPHLTAFDGQTYSHYGSGSFWMAKNDYFDVQVNTQPCYNAPATCNVQVAVRYLDNLWISTIANPTFACHSANNCKDMYGVNLQASADGTTVIQMPGNIKLTNTKQDGKYFNVQIDAPGTDAAKYAVSQCNPGANAANVYTEANKYNVPDSAFAVPASADYFVPNAVALTKPAVNAYKAGYTQCTLPANCDQAYPPAPVVQPEAVQPAAVNAYSGKAVLDGFQPSPKSAYKPYTAPAVVEATVSPCSIEQATDACRKFLPIQAIQIAHMNEKYFVDACAADYRQTPDAQRPAILQANLKSVLTRMKGKLDDCVRTEPEGSERKQQCLRLQQQYSFGTRSCPKGTNGKQCSGNGVCNAYGCRCNPGFTGNACQTVNAYKKRQ